MAIVPCDIETVELESEDIEGAMIDSIQATCGRCGHETQSYGTSGASVRRCLVLMREECPNGEHNFYRAEGGEDGRD